MKKILKSEAEKILACNNTLLLDDRISDEISIIAKEIDDISENSDCIETQPAAGEINTVEDVNTLQNIEKMNKISTNQAFQIALEEMELYIEETGIYSYNQEMKHRRANFSSVSFEYNILENDTRLRVYKFDDTIIELRPQDFSTKASFNRRLLEISNFQIDFSANEYNRFKTVLIEMDNGKVVQNKNGFGRIADGIFNLGNKVMIDRKLHDFKPLIWKGDTGYALEYTDQIVISENRLDLSKIADYLFQLYGNKAILLLGLAVATVFFQEYMKSRKHFPLLYLRGASGHGKSCMAELLCKMFGMYEPLYIINCAGNSTSIGSEIKAVRLNNLPIVFNELTEVQFDLIKSRYDGHGSSKYNEKSSSKLAERPVNNPTIITTVNIPHDKQIISRCVFIDLDEVEMNKSVFEQVRAASPDFYNFIVKIIQSITFEELMDCIDRFAKQIGKTIEPRIQDNYSLIGGGYLAFKAICDDVSGLPSDEEAIQFIKEQIVQTEALLNPLPAFLYELERLNENGKAGSFVTQDENFVYFNFEGVWSEISAAYKDKFFPFMSKRNLQEKIKLSEYIARAGIDLAINCEQENGQPITQYPKKIKAKTRRCYVLKKDKLPSYFT